MLPEERNELLVHVADGFKTYLTRAWRKPTDDDPTMSPAQNRRLKNENSVEMQRRLLTGEDRWSQRDQKQQQTLDDERRDKERKPPAAAAARAASSASDFPRRRDVL